MQLRCPRPRPAADAIECTGKERVIGPQGGREGSMMVKDITKDEAVLSQPCREATAEDAAIAQDLLDTLEATEDAACLAANQIGCPVALAVYLDDADEPHVLYNPKLKKALRPHKVVETCFSRDDEAKVTRFEWIAITYDELADGQLQPRKAERTGWEAQIIQHAIDHCKGKLV